MNETDNGFYNVTEISALLKSTPNAIYKAIHDGKNGVELPPSVKLGKRRLWPKQSYRDWMVNLLSKLPKENATIFQKKVSN